MSDELPDIRAKSVTCQSVTLVDENGKTAAKLSAEKNGLYGLAVFGKDEPNYSKMLIGVQDGEPIISLSSLQRGEDRRAELALVVRDGEVAIQLVDKDGNRVWIGYSHLASLARIGF